VARGNAPAQYSQYSPGLPVHRIIRQALESGADPVPADGDPEPGR